MKRLPRLATLLFALAALSITACTEVTQVDPLPWLRVKKTHYKQFGGWAGGSSEYAFYVKRFGFMWVKLDEVATGPAVALDADTAAISTSQGLKLLARGEEHGALACGSARAGFSIVPEAGAVDCFDVIAGPAASVASQIRWRRISGHGEPLVVEKVSVENPDRLFARAMASFYDAGQQPYFVTLNASNSGPAGCALIWIAGGEARSIAAPADLPRGQCSDVEPWSRLVKRALRKA
jgi:hypothetical protein